MKALILFFSLQLERPEGVKGTVVLNGVTLSQFDGAGTLSMVFNPWLKPSGNTLEIKLEASKKPLEKDAVLDGSVTSRVRGPGEPKSLATLKWAAADGLPKSLIASFNAADAPPIELWGKAQIKTLDDAAKKELTALVNALHAAVAKRDAAATRKLLKFKLEDMARAFGEDPSTSGGMVAQMFEAYPKGVKPQPIKAYDFTPMAEGKIVRGPAIVLKDNDSEIRLELFFGHIDGHWEIVR